MPPVPFVEQVLQSAFAFNAVAGLAIVVWGLVRATEIVARERRRAELGRLELALRQELLQMGMPADEIVKILGERGAGAQCRNQRAGRT